MGVTLVDGRVGTQAIQVAPTLNVPEPDTGASLKYDTERGVVSGVVSIL
jgi:hypothetical protein